MTDWIMQQWSTPWIAFCFYWLPLMFCAVFYTVRTARNYVKDRRERELSDEYEKLRQQPDYRDHETPKHLQGKLYYSPTDTVGTLIGRALVTVIPVANLWAALFDLAPDVLDGFFKWIGRVFDQPLVPKREAK